jgi:WD40 repeat protein/tetratricopeptide (TPR) repeat protein
MNRPDRSMNPFPGLRPFRQDEDYLFFGREEQTMALLQLLGSQRFVAVVGTSGSGKSSLVRCGLLSELLGGKLKKAGASWEVAVTHPGGNPLALLADAILDADLYDREKENARENLLATLSRSHFGLVEAVKQARLGDGVNFLLVVDQFEEIFRYSEVGQQQQEVANEFVSLLLEAVAQTAVPIYIVLTMRSDFIGDCGQFEGLAELVNRGEFLIPRLNREQYKRVIEAPIKVAGGQIAPRLLQRLLNDLGQQADQLPCLQHALMRTWSVWSQHGDGEALDLDDYQRVGRMSEALSLHADEIYGALESDRQRELCAGMFKALTVQESENRGIRRPQRLGTLCQILKVTSEELRPIIDAFRQQQVTFLTPSSEVDLTDNTVIDISHESLMRVWTRLRHWVDEEAQAVGIYRRLSESAALHAQGKAGLYRDPELGIALAWSETSRPNEAWAARYHPGFVGAMSFLEVSRQAGIADEEAQESARARELLQVQQLAEAQRLRLEQQQRAARRLRVMIAGLAAVAVIAALACAAALLANRRANLLAENARQNAKRAQESQHETAKALAKVASQKTQVEGSLSKAEAAERLARTEEEKGRKLLYTTDMRLAPFLWSDDRTTAQKLRELLAKHIPDRAAAVNTDQGAASEKPDLRGFEWYYYEHLLESNATVFAGHEAAVVDAAFAANGQLVTVDSNGQVRRWDIDSQEEVMASRRDLPGRPTRNFRGLSPDGRLAALYLDKKVHVFEASSGKDLFQVDCGNDSDPRPIFARDSGRLIVGADRLTWCNAGSGAVIALFDQKFSYASTAALSADGLTASVVGLGPVRRSFSVFRLDATAKKVTPLAKEVDGGAGTLRASGLSPDGGRIAVGANIGGGVFVYDTTTGRLIAEQPSAHSAVIRTIAFSSDGAKLATADAQGTIEIWADLEKLSSKSTPILTLKGHQDVVNTVSFAGDGRRLVSTSDDKTARVWDLENAGAAIRRLARSRGSFVVRFSPDNLLIAVAAGGSGIRLWDVSTGQLVRELPAGDKGRVHSIAFSPTDNRLLVAGYGGLSNGEHAGVSHVALWDIDTGTELARLAGATDLPDFRVNESAGPVGALAFSPDGKYLAAGFGAKLFVMSENSPFPVKVWEVATRRPIRRLYGHTNYCISLDFSRDGTLLASVSRDGKAILWSTATWKSVQTLKNQDRDPQNRRSQLEPASDGAFSPDGKTLAVASYGGTVQLWDAATGKLLETLKGHPSAVNAVAFSPDGRTLASGGVDQTVRLWNVATRRELMQLDHGSVAFFSVYSLAFSPEGNQLLAGGGATALWSVVPGVWNDPDRAAEKLRLLLQSKADFQSRIRMLSENLGLHKALEKLDGKDLRVQAALAATQANWYASRQRWPEAAVAFDRLVAAEPGKPEDWLRTPGLLRLASALLHQDRTAVAAKLLRGGAKRRAQDGLAAITASDRASVAAGEAFFPLLAEVERRLAKAPRDAGLHELRAELAGQENDFGTQAAEFSAAIKILAEQPAAAVSEPLKRLYRRRGDAYVGLKKWPDAVNDYARVVTDGTADDELLTNQALALAEVMAAAKKWTEQDRLAVSKLADPWQKLAAAYRIDGDQGAIDRLVERRPKLAGPIGDVFTQGNDQKKDWPRAIALYSKGIAAETANPLLLAMRANAYEALGNWEGATADWSRATARNHEGANLLEELARRLAAAGQVDLAKRSYKQSRALYEHALTEDPANNVVATELARLLLDDFDIENPGRWAILEPTSIKSAGGAVLTKQSDGSILASGTNPDRDTYTLVATTDLDHITALKLEALPDPSLPYGGPGRDPGFGDFHVNELRVFSGGKPCALSALAVTYNPLEDAPDMIDGKIDESLGWGNGYRYGKSNTAVLATRVERSGGAEIKIEMHFSRSHVLRSNLGRFRLSVSAGASTFEQEKKRFASMNLGDPWARLAFAYRFIGDQPAVDRLLEHHPSAAVGIGDLYAADGDWDRAIAEYRKVITDQPPAGDLAGKLGTAYQGAGRTPEAVPLFAVASSADPTETQLFLKVAALQAWFGQMSELAASRQRILAIAKGNPWAITAERAARSCSLIPHNNKADIETALALARTGVDFHRTEWTLLALGMAQYRGGTDAEADKSLLAAMEAGKNTPQVRGTAAFYRAMSLFRQGKKDEARKLATETAATMKPLPKDENNPLAGDATPDDLILWLACKEAKAMIQ